MATHNDNAAAVVGGSRKRKAAAQSSLARFFGGRSLSSTTTTAVQASSSNDAKTTQVADEARKTSSDAATTPLTATTTASTASSSSSFSAALLCSDLNHHDHATLPSLSTKLPDPMVPHVVRRPRHVSWHVHDNAVLVRHTMAHISDEQKFLPKRTKVAAFDLDGTLVQWTCTGWPSQLSDYELWHASIIAKLQNLHDTGHDLIIVSNQGGIRRAHQGKIATRVQHLLDWLEQVVQRPLMAVVSCGQSYGYHKPSVRLWDVAAMMARHQHWNIAESFYVGDSAGGPDDAQAGVDVQFAHNVGAAYHTTFPFYTPDHYFGPSAQQLRQEQQQKQRASTAISNVPPAALPTRAALVSGTLMGPIMLMLCGAQGAGKSTLAAQIVAQHDDHDVHGSTQASDALYWIYLSQDTIQHGQPGQRAQVEAATHAALHAGQCVIVDRMHLDAHQRRPFVQLAHSLDVPCHVIVLTPPADVVTQRVHERRRGDHVVHGVRGVALAQQSMTRLQPPDYGEGFALVSTSSTDAGVRRLANWYRQVGPPPPSSSSSTLASVPAARLWRPQLLLPTEFALRNNVLLPAVALGTLQLGRGPNAVNAIQRANGAGICAIDTAPTYNNEDVIGQTLASLPGGGAGTFCIIKVPKSALHGVDVRSAVQQSLQASQRATADVVLLHWPCQVLASGTMVEVWRAMEALLGEGLTRALGVCNCTVAALHATVQVARIVPALHQLERHPLLPGWDVMEFCAQHDIVVQAHTPLGHGAATLLNDGTVVQIATETLRTPAQVVLEWNLRQGVAIVPKVSTAAHLDELRQVMTEAPVLTHAHMTRLNHIETRHRFVDPPFMRGASAYCWNTTTTNC